MRVLGRSGFGLELVLLGTLLVPIGARAQSGFYITPSVSLAEVYDDNLFFTASRRQSDVITRLSPDIQAGYRSPTLELLGRYTFDAEAFAEHPELSTAQARQQASLDVRYLPTPLLTLSLDGGYQTTQTPAELNVQTGLQAARASAERVVATPSVAYRLDPVTTGAADYTFTRDTQSGGTTVDTHVANLGLDRRLTEWDTAAVGYTLRQFEFSGSAFGGGGTTTAHLVTVGWTRQLTPLTRVALRGGPRLSEGSAAAEASASIRHLLRRGEVSLAYERTQATVIGQPGVVESDSFTAALVYQPLASLRLRAAPSFILSAGPAGQAKVYRATLDATYQITRSISLTGSYEFTRQEGTVGSVGRRNDEILHNVFLVRLTVTFPFRVR